MAGASGEPVGREPLERSYDLLLRRGHRNPVVAVTRPSAESAVSSERLVLGDARERFEVGSVTKVLTGLLLARLAEQGVVALGDLVPRWLPSGLAVAPGVQTITLEQLSTHTAGLPRLPPGVVQWKPPERRAQAVDPYAAIDSAAMHAAVATTKVRAPGQVRYSNFGVGLLGYLLGRSTGLGYRQTLHREVLEPLGMRTADFSDDALHQGRNRRGPVTPWHLAELAGAGGVRASAADLLRLLEAVAGRGDVSNLGRAIAETTVPRANVGRASVGLGWFILGDGQLLTHDGGTGGARSQVRCERTTGIGVVVLGDARRGTATAAGRLLRPARSPGRGTRVTRA